MRSRSRLKAIPAIIYTALLVLVCISGPFHEAPSDVKPLIGPAPAAEVTLSCGTYPVETTELTAVIQGLRLLKEPCAVELWSDSKYVIDALDKGWARSWQRRGWVKSDKKPALNPDLWEQLLSLCDTHAVRCHWVKGHAENPYNNRCDELAVAESRKFR